MQLEGDDSTIQNDEDFNKDIHWGSFLVVCLWNLDLELTIAPSDAHIKTALKKSQITR